MEYCLILAVPYRNRYEVLQIWMDFITLILSELEDKKKYIAIMDDLLIHSTKVDHWKLLEQLLKSMCKNGLRLKSQEVPIIQDQLDLCGK